MTTAHAPHSVVEPPADPISTPEGPLPTTRSTTQRASRAVRDLHSRGRHASRSAPSVPLVAVSAALVVLVVLGVVVACVVGNAPSPSRRPSAATALTIRAARQIARQANLSAVDLPSGWTVDDTVTGPLSAFLDRPSLGGSFGTGLANGPLGAAGTATAARFARCMGTSGSISALFEGDGPPPVAHAASPAFAAGTGSGAVEEVASSTNVFALAASVRADAALVDRPDFSRCFGAAVSESVEAQAGSGSDSTAIFGTPQVRPFAVPQSAVVAAAGVDLDIPVSQDATDVEVDLQFVLVDGGRVESSLFSMAIGRPMTDRLTRSLIADLEHQVAALGSGAGA